MDRIRKIQVLAGDRSSPELLQHQQREICLDANMHSLNKSATYFSEREVYPCPICRYSQLSPLLLMDAMACDSCRHIFTTDIEKQQIKMADRQPPLIWRWNGKKWTEAHVEGVELGWAYWLGGIAFVVLPTTLLGLTVYTRPPLPGSPLSWLPTVWTGLAFLLHLVIVVWLVIEFYEFPIWAYVTLSPSRRR